MGHEYAEQISCCPRHLRMKEVKRQGSESTQRPETPARRKTEAEKSSLNSPDGMATASAISKGGHRSQPRKMHAISAAHPRIERFSKNKSTARCGRS